MRVYGHHKSSVMKCLFARIIILINPCYFFVFSLSQDCFYAQVERERFPHWLGKPIAVVQNGAMCVAVNYDVRMRGSKKIGQAAILHRLVPQTMFAGRYVLVLLD